LGTGTWWNEDFDKISDAMNMFSNLANSSVPLGMFGSVLSGIEVGKIGVGVQCDLRVIKAATGEVIWSKRVVGVHDQVNLNLGVASIGNRKLNNNFYAKAMDKAAQKIVDSLVADSKNIFQ
jgi:curli biogenesis system outer membrane secretion channel CsgG